MKPINIYLADDDQEDRNLFIEALKEIPLKTAVTQFDNGVDLMDDLFSEELIPDVVFLDLRMPIMDGFEMCEKIKQNGKCLVDIRNFKQFSNIKVIVYSSSYHQREVDQLKADGANKYIQKPNSFNQLKTLLYKSLKPLADNSENKTATAPFVILA